MKVLQLWYKRKLLKGFVLKLGTRDAGAITYSIEYYADAEELFTVPSNCFIPMPNVESEVITLKLRKEKKYKVNDEEKLFKLIKYAFMQRRKTFTNAIQNLDFCGGKENIKKILEKLQIDVNVRGEALTLGDFINIANMM